MENGRIAVSTLFLALLTSSSVAADPAPDCNRNQVADSEDLVSGLSRDGNGNGIPDECESRIRIVEVGPSEVALAVEHSVPSAVYILFWLFQGGSPPPLPGPYQCGVDPTPDALDCASYAFCPFE